MKPLIVLLAVFGLLAAGTYFVQGTPNYLLAGNGAMAAMLLFTGAAHFAFTQGMMRMLPDWLPAKKAWVYATGVLELAAAVGLLIPGVRMSKGGSL
ncbi:DoxX family protein [Hymenobacter sediminis]|uniref:DoxX family protein n=1 Tax=Hymenobacter sediminis TaxID=2218621 RepID=UPI00192E5EA8|nr:DoxX family protein [Hymenobacter sediminis]